MANKVIMKGNWNVLKGKLKQTWGNLTEDDLVFEEGREEELFGRIQRRTGESIENIRRKVEHLASQQ